MNSLKVTFIIFDSIASNIEKIKSQGLQGYEIIFIDLNNKYEKKIHNVTYIDGKDNISLALSKAIEIAKFNFIKIVDVDFSWPDDFLKKQIKFLELNTTCSVTSSRLSTLDNNKYFSPVDLSFAPISEDRHIVSLEEIKPLIFRNGISISGYLSQCLFVKPKNKIHYEDILKFNDTYAAKRLEIAVSLKLLQEGNLIINNDLYLKDEGIFAAKRSEKEIEETKEYYSFLSSETETSKIIKSIEDNINSIKKHNKLLPYISSKEDFIPSVNLATLEFKKTNTKKIALVEENNNKEILLNIGLNNFFEFKTLDEVLNNPESCDWVILVNNVKEFLPIFLIQLALVIARKPQCNLVITDSLEIDHKGVLSEIFLPGINLDLMISNPSIYCKTIIARSEVVREIFDVDESIEKNNFKLINYSLYQIGLSSIAHFSNPIAVTRQTNKNYNDYLSTLEEHLRNRGFNHSIVTCIDAEKCIYKIKINQKANKNTSIIIESKNSLESTLDLSMDILSKNKEYIKEIIIYRNASEKFRDSIKTKKIASEISILYDDYNLNNAFEKSSSEFLLFISKEVNVLSENAVQVLTEPLLRDEIAATSIKVFDSDGNYFLTGEILGLNGQFSSPLRIDNENPSTHLEIDKSCFNFNILSDKIFCVSRNKYLAISENFTKNNNTIKSYFLNATEFGFLLHWSPHAFAKLTPKIIDKKNNIQNYDDLIKNNIHRVKNEFYYNKNYISKSIDFNDINFSYPSFSELIEPYKSNKILSIPSDHFGCGHYRIIHPSDAINHHATGHSILRHEFPIIFELIRHDIDSIIIQKPINSEIPAYIKSISKYKQLYKVTDSDDNYLDIHSKHPLYKKYDTQFAEEILRISLSYFDKFIVSTQNLADRYSHLHNNIVVIKNKLPSHPWKYFKAHPVKDRKPRVGWGGGSSHLGDLDLISGVVKSLHHEVDWVFLGMCPPSLRSYVKEVHEGVSFKDYPHKLFSLDLDVAVAPLEDNAFNICKSNLRLLEFGACGFPVVCSDIGPYHQTDLPVTAVPNRYKEWIDAIRYHISDLNKAKEKGLRLQAYVHDNYMLDRQSSRLWCKAWTE